MNKKIMINFGCGMTPVKDYLNYDNSLAISLKILPLFVINLLRRVSIVNESSFEFIIFAKNNKIRKLDVRKRLPFFDSSVDFVYSSHMVEHLYHNEAIFFLSEVKRVLRDGCRVRLVLPDLGKLINSYTQTKDADQFMISSLLYETEESSLLYRLKLFFIGPRKHQWMYDSKSIKRLLESIGFNEVVSLNPGETTASNLGELNLFEGGDSSIFIEAVKR